MHRFKKIIHNAWCLERTLNLYIGIYGIEIKLYMRTIAHILFIIILIIAILVI